MTATAERAVHGHVAGHGSKALEHFLDHDRTMGARESLAGRHDLSGVRGVPLRVQFLVFLMERAGMRARISRAPLMGH